MLSSEIDLEQGPWSTTTAHLLAPSPSSCHRKWCRINLQSAQQTRSLPPEGAARPMRPGEAGPLSVVNGRDTSPSFVLIAAGRLSPSSMRPSFLSKFFRLRWYGMRHVAGRPPSLSFFTLPSLGFFYATQQSWPTVNTTNILKHIAPHNSHPPTRSSTGQPETLPLPMLTRQVKYRFATPRSHMPSLSITEGI